MEKVLLKKYDRARGVEVKVNPLPIISLTEAFDLKKEDENEVPF